MSSVHSYNKAMHVMLKSMAEASEEYDKTLHISVCDNTKLMCISFLNEFEHTCLTKTGRYTRKDLPFTESCRETVFYLALKLKQAGYDIEGLERFDYEENFIA